MRNEIQYWLKFWQSQVKSFEMLWQKAFPHQLPRPELFVYSFWESLRNGTIYLSERHFYLIYRNNFDHSKNGRMRGVCNCETWGSASQVDLFKAISFPHAHIALTLKCLASVSHVCLILETCRPSALLRDSEPGCSLQSPGCWLNQGRWGGAEEIHLMD